MKAIAKFYTYFWIIYFPVCIAFTYVVNFDYSDEVLTVLLLLYAINHKHLMQRAQKRVDEIKIYIIFMLCYLAYSFMVDITTPRGIWLDFLQQIRPYAVFYLTWMMAPKFNKKQKKQIVAVMLLSFFGYLTAFMVKPELVSPYGGEESAALGQIALCCGMIYLLFTEHTAKNKYIAICIMLLGLASGKSKYIGECIAFISLVLFVKDKIKLDSLATYLKVGALASVILFFTWTKFNVYYIEGFKEGAKDMARPLTYMTGLQIMQDYFPFGSGLGTFACAAAAKEYSPLYKEYHLDNIWGLDKENPMFLADTFYPIVYSEFGIIGVFFFLVFWKRRLNEANTIIDTTYYRMALMCILALALENTADSSYVSGKGMAYFMILAVCLNSNLYLKKEYGQRT